MYFLYVMKDKGLPVGEIFEKEIKDIPTSWFSKNLDDSVKISRKDDEMRLGNVSDLIFHIQDDSIASFESLIFPITDIPAKFAIKPKNVPKLNFDRLAPWKEHYFSKSSDWPIDLTLNWKHKYSYKQKYDLASCKSVNSI